MTPTPATDSYVESAHREPGAERERVAALLVEHAWNSEFGVCACGYPCELTGQWAEHVAEVLSHA